MKKFIKINDISICYQEEGQGSDVVLLLHGNGESKEIYNLLIGDLKEKYHVYALDSRGHGESYYDDNFTLKDIVNDLKEFINQLEYERLSIIGFSDGGNVALMHALENHVDNMVLIGPNIFPSGVKLGWQILTYLKYFGFKIKNIFNKDYRKKIILYRLMLKEPNMKYRDLEKIEAKCLLIAGEDDMIKRSHLKKIKTSLKNCQFIEIENASHFVLIDRYAKTAKAIKEFLEG